MDDGSALLKINRKKIFSEIILNMFSLFWHCTDQNASCRSGGAADVKIRRKFHGLAHQQFCFMRNAFRSDWPNTFDQLRFQSFLNDGKISDLMSLREDVFSDHWNPVDKPVQRFSRFLFARLFSDYRHGDSGL